MLLSNSQNLSLAPRCLVSGGIENVGLGGVLGLSLGFMA